MKALLAKYLLGLALTLAVSGAQAACYDMKKSEPHKLTGLLSYKTFPGPPNYEDVSKGDAPEGAYILTLLENICLQADGEFSDPDEMFKDVHLVPTEATQSDLAALKNRQVVVTLERQMSAHTAHHHAPLVAWVAHVEPAEDLKGEHGAAQTAIHAFYMALAEADGDAATRLLVPEKRGKGPLSADSITAFYGNFTEPLTLMAITSSGKDQYTVSYRYKAGNRACNGQSIVTMTRRRGADLIKAIKAVHGC